MVNSPGVRPNGMSGSPLDGKTDKTVLLSYSIGAPGPRNGPFVEVAKSPWRPFGAPRLDFALFWRPRTTSKNHVFSTSPEMNKIDA